MNTGEKRPRTKDGIIIGKWLDCGCCGGGFQVWETYEDQDQDTGYGICMRCQLDDAMRNIEQYIIMFHLIEGALSVENRAKFQSHDTDLRIAIANKMLNAGIITWSI